MKTGLAPPHIRLRDPANSPEGRWINSEEQDTPFSSFVLRVSPPNHPPVLCAYPSARLRAESGLPWSLNCHSIDIGGLSLSRSGMRVPAHRLAYSYRGPPAVPWVRPSLALKYLTTISAFDSQQCLPGLDTDTSSTPGLEVVMHNRRARAQPVSDCDSLSSLQIDRQTSLATFDGELGKNAQRTPESASTLEARTQIPEHH